MSETTAPPRTAGGATASADLSLLRIHRPPGPSAAAPRRSRGGRLGLLVLLAILCLVGWLFWPRISEFVTTARAITVKTGNAVRTRPGANLELTNATGYVVPRTRAALSPKIAGKLIDLRVDAGSRVEKGQLLARLDDSIYRHALDEAKAMEAEALAEEKSAATKVKIAESAADRARLDVEETKAAIGEWRVELAEAERIHAREKGLLEKGAGTPEAVAQAAFKRDLLLANITRAESRVKSQEGAVRSAEAEISGQQARIAVAVESTKRATAAMSMAQTNLNDTEIRAEFTGVVIKKDAEIGEMVVPAIMGGQSTRGAVVTLVDFATLEMEVDVFERDLHFIKEGGPARIILDSYPEEPFPAIVRQIQPTADRQKATVVVKVAFAKPDERVLPEMGGRAVFLRSSAESLPAPEVVAPPSAITTVNGVKGVFELAGDRVRFTPVSTGETRKSGIVITQGLRGGEVLVLNPPVSLTEGTLVKREKSDG